MQKTVQWRSANGFGRISEVTLLSGPASTGIGDCLRVADHLRSRYITSHPGLLSLLPSAGREISTGLSDMMLCGLE